MVPVPSDTWLIDMQGRFVHRWKLPGWIRLHAVLLPNGNLLCGLADPDAPFADLPFAGGEIVELDWDGNVVWRYVDPLLDCHDRAPLKNGNIMVNKYVKVPQDIAAKVKGGLPGTERDGVMWGYVMQEINRKGEVVWEWLSYEHLDPELDALTPMGIRFIWPGWNSIIETPDGRIMTCSFNTSYLHIIDRKTGDVQWRWGQGIIAFPHNPTMLDNGNVLVLDNGRSRYSWWPPDWSRVIEVNPNTNEIEWEYKDDNPVDFHTPYIGGCQRLPNGNTLICEGAMGRLLEVTPKGEIVWEYIVPFYAERKDTIYGMSNCTFRCLRYGPDYPGLQGKKLDPEKLDLWNRLYGPEAFSPYAKPSWAGEERSAIEEERAAMEKRAPQVDYKESAPSVGKPGEEDKTASRLEMLGY